MKWYDKPLRMMRRDYIVDFQRFKKENLDKRAREVKEKWYVNAEWIMGNPGAEGLSYYVSFNTPKFPALPDLKGFDCIREYLPYAHKHGLKIIVYINLHWFSYEFAKEYSHWEQKLANGQSYGKVNPLYGNGTTFCINGPWRDWSFELLKETGKTGIDGIFCDGPVLFPGTCYCRHCQEKFSQRYGQEIPKEENWSDPVWKNFVEFREDSLAEWLADARKSLQSVNPEAIIYLNGGKWNAGEWRIARDIQKLEKHEDINGAEQFFYLTESNYPLLASAMLAKYLAAGNRPAMVFTHYALGVWHYLPLPEWETKLAIAQTVACGANPWIAVFDYALEQNKKEVIRPINEIQGFLAKNEEYYTNTVSVAKVALLASHQSNLFYVSSIRGLYKTVASGKEEGLVADLKSGEEKVVWSERKRVCEDMLDQSYMGYFNVLTRQHILFDVILDQDLNNEKLKKYEMLILPNSACLSDRQIEVIKNFVYSGKGLVASFEVGEYDERGNKRQTNPLSDLLGIEKIESVMDLTYFEQYLRDLETKFLVPRPPFALKVNPIPSAEITHVFLEPTAGLYSKLQKDSDNPAVLQNKFGNGKVVYFSALVAYAYNKFRIEQYEKIIVDAVQYVNPNEPFIKVDALSTVEVEVRKQTNPERMIIHLINATGDMQRPIKQIVPVTKIKIKLKNDKCSKMYQLSNKKQVNFIRNAEWVEFMLPKLEFYDCVVLE